MKVYLFKRKKGTTHAVITRWNSLGAFELDRILGGGFKMLCGGKCQGAGILSEITMSSAWVTCKKCRDILKNRFNLMKRKPKNEQWPPRYLRKLDNNPRIFGIPG